jgi:CRP/FNR family transcriptional regulator, cyclic AMP receptor protein
VSLSQRLGRCQDGVVDWWVLDALSEEDRSTLTSTLHRRTYRRGEVIFHEGDPAETLHLIAVGHVSAHVSAPSGEPVIVSVLGRGDCFGELALAGPGRARAATVTALDRCETLSLTRAQFDRLRSQSPHLDRLLVLLLAARIERLNGYLLEALYTPASRRVALRLLELCESYRADGGQVVIPLTQEALANLAGTTRPTTNQALQDLARRGVLELQRGSVVVVDEPGLERISRPRRPLG